MAKVELDARTAPVKRKPCNHKSSCFVGERVTAIDPVQSTGVHWCGTCGAIQRDGRWAYPTRAIEKAKKGKGFV